MSQEASQVSELQQQLNIPLLNGQTVRMRLNLLQRPTASELRGIRPIAIVSGSTMTSTLLRINHPATKTLSLTQFA